MSSDSKSLKGKKILLVDDIPDNLDILRRTLKSEGYEISVASSGEDALKIVPGLLPDLILLDIMMPGVDGFETCRKLKSNKSTENIPIIFVTAKAETNDVVEGLSLGAVDHISKPFRPAEVRARVKTHLHLQNLMKQSEKAEESIKLYSRKIERSNQDLADFASIASHDLQEPLRKVMGFTDRLEGHAKDVLDERGKDYLNRIQKSTTRMQTFISDLLQFSGLNTKAKPFEPTNLEKVVKGVLGDLEARIAQTKGKVNVDISVTLDADPFQMRQLFLNLIGNSLKFHKKDETPVVNVRGRRLDNGLCEIVVEDNGVGFDKKGAERIFKPFERLHGRSAYEGSGIGLAICRKIVDRHGGEINAKSEPQKGSSFTITLPEKQSRKNSD